MSNDISTEYYSSTYYNSSNSSGDYSDSSREENDIIYGKVLKNNYFLITKLGSGSFSSVWLSYSLSHDTLVAIKIANPEDYDEGILEYEFIRQNKEENDNLVNFITKFIIRYTIDDEEINRLCIVMDLMICSSYDLLKIDSKLSNNIVYQILIQIEKVIKKIHNLDYIHTDIKPENIMIKKINNMEATEIHNIYRIFLTEIRKLNLQNRLQTINITNNILEDINNVLIKLYHKIDENTLSIKLDDTTIIETVLIDFGTIKKKSDNMIEIVQTRYYRSPEVILRYNWNEKIDLWSFGCVLYELLTSNILIDSCKDDKYDRNMYHILKCELITNTYNKSKSYFSSGLSYDKYYTNGILNIDNNLNDKPFDELLFNELKSRYSHNDILKWITILKSYITFNPSDRHYIDFL